MSKTPHSEDEKYMYRCIQLAQNGRQGAVPNPMVGAVVVCNGKIIGEGYHIRCGGPHAEVNAIASVRQQEMLRKSTIYVSLEPCSHYGKTPPCADLIIKKGIPRIVIGCADPFSKVAGQGIQKLKDAGREVIVGVLEEECKLLNRQFMTFHMLKRPYVTLKWAESKDGYIGTTQHDLRQPCMISSPLTQMLTHKRRAEHQAILVGRHTAELDNSQLDVRYWVGKSPIRLVLDQHLNIPTASHVFDGNIPTLVFTARQHERGRNLEYVILDYSHPIIPQILSILHQRGIQSLLVEGGRELLQSFIDSGNWDDIYIEKGTLTMGEGVPAPTIRAPKSIKNSSFFGRKYTIIHNFI